MNNFALGIISDNSVANNSTQIFLMIWPILSFWLQLDLDFFQSVFKSFRIVSSSLKLSTQVISGDLKYLATTHKYIYLQWPLLPINSE